MKILQGNLKETLFDWPGKKGLGEMLKKSERVLRVNQCAYVNGKSFYVSLSLTQISTLTLPGIHPYDNDL